MLVAYASLTGKVHNFIGRLEKELPSIKTIRIRKDTIVDEPFVLITYTIGHGDIPKPVTAFLENNGSNILAVIGSGEKNWGEHRYCKASIDISKQFNIPLLHNFEKSGYDSDVKIVANKILDLERKR